MDAKSKILLTVAMLFSAANAIANTFLSVFLMRSTDNSINLIIWQNILNYLVLLLAFVGSTRLLKRFTIAQTFRAGIAATALYYILILIFHTHIAPFVVPLGLFSGLGSGLYWFSLNLLIGDIVKEPMQARFFSYQQTAGFIFGIVIPALSGFLIVQFTGLTGYYILFAASILVFAAAIFLIKNISGFKREPDLNVFGALRLRGNKFWAANKMLEFSIGYKNAVNSLVFILFAYLLFTHENIIGSFSSLQAAISVISSLIFARAFRQAHTRGVYLLTACASAGMFIILALFANPISLIIAFIVFGIIQSWGNAISNAVNYQLASRAGGGFSQREYIIASEFPIAAGRIGGLLLALLLVMLTHSDLTAYRLLFVSIALMWLIEYFYINHKVHWLADEFKKTES
ncbi:MAG: MFS transporter [Streptococcaceae bacterium]|jgi:YQGE family putative transporter|nr:MFS transporter [Streptococcaceae bacterium]